MRDFFSVLRAKPSLNQNAKPLVAVCERRCASKHTAFLTTWVGCPETNRDSGTSPQRPSVSGRCWPTYKRTLPSWQQPWVLAGTGDTRHAGDAVAQLHACTTERGRSRAGMPPLPPRTSRSVACVTNHSLHMLHTSDPTHPLNQALVTYTRVQLTTTHTTAGSDSLQRAYRWACYKKAAKYPRFVHKDNRTPLDIIHPAIPDTNIRMPQGTPGQAWRITATEILRDQGMLEHEMQPLKVRTTSLASGTSSPVPAPSAFTTCRTQAPVTK